MLVYIKPKSLIPKLHSDRLFGAITSAIHELFPSEIEGMISKFENNNPPFLISSTFPCIWVNDEKIRFFPKIIFNNSKIETNLSVLKDYKKVEYIEESLFFDLINCNLSEKDILNDYNNYYRVKNLLIKNTLNGKFSFNRVVVSNNSINRLTNETKIFYTEGFNFSSDVGLFFFVEILNSDYDKIIRASLKFLKDRGLGNNISSGKGQFDYEISDLSINDLTNSKSNFSIGGEFINLSRFIPSKDDLVDINELSYYEIGFKRGKDKNGDIRKQIRFFNEGSLFNNYKKYCGRIVYSGTVKRPAIEYGYVFPLIYNFKGD